MRFFFYGSLKRGHGNNQRFELEKKASFLGEQALLGWDMWDLGAYPCITPGEGTISGEVWELEKEEADWIRRMELGAGYEEGEIESEKWGPTKIYFMASAPRRGVKILPIGGVISWGLR